MRVCMLTTTHGPLDVRIFYKESKSLSKFCEVVIVAPDEKAWEKAVGNVKIIAVKKPENKLLHFITLWRVLKEGLKQDCEVYHCHEPDSLMIGVILKLLKRNKVKLVYDAHEHWPSEIAYGWFKIRNKILRKVVEFLSLRIEQFLAKSADCIVVVSNSVGERFRKISGFFLIPNVPLVDMIENSDYEKNCEIVQMGGGIQSYHGINEIIFALLKVRKHNSGVKLKIIGNVKANIESIVEKHSLTKNVMFTGFRPFREMYEEIKKGKIGLVIMKSEFYNAYIGLPNKLFDYMLCELAVVASDYPEISKIVKRAKCGILVNPNNVEEIANAIIYLLENPAEARKMGVRGRGLVEREMNWEKMEKKLIEIYRSFGRWKCE